MRSHDDEYETFPGFGRDPGVWRNPELDRQDTQPEPGLEPGLEPAVQAVPPKPNWRKRGLAPVPDPVEVEAETPAPPKPEGPPAAPLSAAEREDAYPNIPNIKPGPFAGFNFQSGETPQPPGPDPRRRRTVIATAAALGAVALVAGIAAVNNPGDTGKDARHQAADAAVASPAATPANAPVVQPPPAPVAPPALRDVKVAVLDLSGGQAQSDGLVRDLQAGGWGVSGTDRFKGKVPTTTVYFPKGREEEAYELAAQFPLIHRVKPAFTGLSTTRLSVVLVAEDGTKPPERVARP